MMAVSGALAAVPACRRRAPPLAVTPFTRALMTVGVELGASAPADVAAGLDALPAMASQVQQRLNEDPTRSLASALNKTVFDGLGFVREVDDTNLRFVLLPSVLRDRRGSCVGLGTLYLALGQMVGQPIEAVLVPGHFYLRAREGQQPRNIELLRRGEEMPNDWYRTRYPGAVDRRASGDAAPTDGTTYGRVLTPDEVLGVIAYNIGQEERRRTRLPQARHAYGKAITLFPAFAEAHASLGAVAHLLGDLPAAAAAYGRAAELNPGLSGLERNRQLLDNELRQNR